MQEDQAQPCLTQTEAVVAVRRKEEDGLASSDLLMVFGQNLQLLVVAEPATDAIWVGAQVGAGSRIDTETMVEMKLLAALQIEDLQSQAVIVEDRRRSGEEDLIVAVVEVAAGMEAAVSGPEEAEGVGPEEEAVAAGLVEVLDKVPEEAGHRTRQASFPLLDLLLHGGNLGAGNFQTLELNLNFILHRVMVLLSFLNP